MPETAPGVHARRVIFIDLARALAVVLMVYGHTISALLAPEYRSGPWYDAWLFQRGLTSSLFLLLSGFAFSIATTRHWTVAHVRLAGGRQAPPPLHASSSCSATRCTFRSATSRRSPTSAASAVAAFLAVDVLQLIGVDVHPDPGARDGRRRSRRVFMAASFVLAVLTSRSRPRCGGSDWTDVLPLALASYLSPANGSQFPLFPFRGIGADWRRRRTDSTRAGARRT